MSKTLSGDIQHGVGMLLGSDVDLLNKWINADAQVVNVQTVTENDHRRVRLTFNDGSQYQLTVKRRKGPRT